MGTAVKLVLLQTSFWCTMWSFLV